MADELRATGLPAALSTVFAVAMKGSQYYNGVTPEAYNAGHYTNYARAMTEKAPGDYFADSPDPLATSYKVQIKQGVAAAPSDPVVFEDVLGRIGVGGGTGPTTVGINEIDTDIT